MRITHILTALALLFVVESQGCTRMGPRGGGAAAPATSDVDWPSYNRTVAGDRFSPLGEITRANVSALKQVCSYSLPEVTSLQTGPIVVAGTMYFTTDTISYAIDAATCAEHWKRVRHSPTPSALAVNRGLAEVPISGGAFWTSFTFDAPNGVLYVPAGNPAPDFDIEVRRGDNLYTNSVIALDAATGRMLGYNQLVKHDTHDWDVDSPPTLATTRSGRPIIASANKNGLLSILDRSRLERSVQPGGAELGSMLPIVAEVPTTTRENLDVPLSRDHVVHFCPGITGGTEWNGAAFDPQLNSIYVGAVDLCANVQLEPLHAPVPAAGQTWLAAGNPYPEIADPAETARGWVTSYDAENGAVRWKRNMPHPILAGVTPTAGGVVFTADMGGVLYALDAADGRPLWQFDSGQSTGGGVITYVAGGRQLLGVASGMKSSVWPGAAQQSRILVFGLR